MLRLLLLMCDWVVLVELCRLIKGVAEFFLDLERWGVRRSTAWGRRLSCSKDFFSLAERQRVTF